MKIGFSEISLLCSMYIYSQSQTFSIILAVLAIIGATFDYVISREKQITKEDKISE